MVAISPQSVVAGVSALSKGDIGGVFKAALSNVPVIGGFLGGLFGGGGPSPEEQLRDFMFNTVIPGLSLSALSTTLEDDMQLDSDINEMMGLEDA